MKELTKMEEYEAKKDIEKMEYCLFSKHQHLEIG